MDNHAAQVREGGSQGLRTDVIRWWRHLTGDPRASGSGVTALSLSLAAGGLLLVAAWYLKTDHSPPRWTYLIAVPAVVVGAVGALGRLLRSFHEPVREPISERSGNARFWGELGVATASALGFGLWGLFDRDSRNDLVCAVMVAVGLTAAWLAMRHLRKPCRGIPFFDDQITIAERLGTKPGGFGWREKLGLSAQLRYPIDSDKPTGICHVAFTNRPQPLCGDVAETLPVPGNPGFASIPARIRCVGCERQLVRLARLASPNHQLGADASRLRPARGDARQ